MPESETRKKTTDKNTDKPAHASYTPPKGKTSRITLGGARYTVHADWMVLRKEDKPIAEMFHIAYLRDGSRAPSRPITFVFNGGPGAASAYLHVGALGPRRIDFGVRGAAPAMPIQLVDNKESWLAFTDLVFIDPIGTGFSRVIERETAAPSDSIEKPGVDSKEFYQLNRDLDSIGECITRALTQYKRWSSPVYIAGESYGGFRVGKMARRLQEKFGVGLTGALLISPALEFTALDYSDYNVTPWIGVFPSLVASSWWHNSSREKVTLAGLRPILEQAEEFVRSELAPFLVDGRNESVISAKIATLLKLDPAVVSLARGRISAFTYVREFLRKERLVCGLYDATVTAADPFSDRSSYAGPEPTLTSIGSPFTHGANLILREVIGLDTTRQYHLLSDDVFHHWKLDQSGDSLSREVGATDDLRYGISLNPKMKVHLSHGVFDLITPYFSSKRIIELLPLTKDERERVTVSTFFGGHMYYSWKASRQEFFAEGKKFYS